MKVTIRRQKIIWRLFGNQLANFVIIH